MSNIGKHYGKLPGIHVVLIVLLCFVAANSAPSYLTEINAKMKAAVEKNDGGQLRILRNEIYARRGRAFSSPDLASFFGEKKWYKQNPSYHDSLLSKEEVELVQEIVRIEQSLPTKDLESGWNDKASSTVQFLENNGWYRKVITNHSYLYTPVYRREVADMVPVVLSQEIVSTHNEQMEGTLATLHTIAYKVQDGKKGTKLWELKQDANEGKIHSTGCYETVWWGCCSMYNSHNLYGILNGKLVLEFSATPAKVEVPNTRDVRIIGYKGLETLHRHDFAKQRNFVGLLTYSTPDSMIAQIAFFAKDAESCDRYFGLGWADPIVSSPDTANRSQNEGKYLALWGSANKVPYAPGKIGGFVVKLKWYSDEMDTVSIPIENDNIAEESVKSPLFKIRRVL